MSINLGLARITKLLKAIHDPHLKYHTVHIAGTNGKGSVAAIIANTCRLAGIRTGLYTSPHLVRESDCINIDGREIELDVYQSIKKSLRAKTDALDLSPFEEITAIAFEAFQQEKMQLAVIETGLGGRLDATNVVMPILSIITKIGIDHTAFLGNTLEAIAREKAGIIKSGAPVLLNGDQESDSVLKVVQAVSKEINPGSVVQRSPTIVDDFQESNRELARSALRIMQDKFPQLTQEVIDTGIKSTRWKGRLERIDLSILGGSVDVLLDGAHNEQSIKALSKLLKSKDSEQRTFIFALTKGKDPSILSSLLRPRDTFISVEFGSVQGMPWIAAEASSAIFASKQLGCASRRDMGSDLLGAIRSAQGSVVICGSLYLIGKVHSLLEEAKRERTFSDNFQSGAYDSQAVESRVTRYWQSSVVKPRPRTDKEIKTFLLPPPNITGSLHIGHALTIAIQDSYARYYAANGHSVSWIPGSDHAGIATQTVVAKALLKEGISSDQLGRPDLIERIWEWKETYGGVISHQIQRLGAKLDWEKEYFTLDKQRSDAVQEAFRKLWQAGLISRERRMINWSTSLGSVISDIEVETKQIDQPTLVDGAIFGQIWTIKYQLMGEIGTIETQTTRPETIFGDRALAVHPQDSRYIHLHGRYALHPLLPGIRLQIIPDEMVDPKFGSGVVKITPAHDSDDYQFHQRHPEVPLIVVFGKSGRMKPIPEYPELSGVDRLKARQRVVDLLTARKALVKHQVHPMRLNLCSRSGCVLEPTLMPQWYIDMKPLAQSVLQQDTIKMTERTSNEWHRWLQNIQPWCISRQLVWGHRIPLWKSIARDTWVFGTSETEALMQTGGEAVVQDADVLDTWFSSAILPLSAFGWPNHFDGRSYPLTFIESGPDILFFWLARMAMLCTFLSPSQSAPFKEILLHPLVRDSQGRKMSKSLGNVINPLHVIDGITLREMKLELQSGNLAEAELGHAVRELEREFPKGIKSSGTDALRFALINSTVQDTTLNLDMRNVAQGRYLCTKLWNAVKFYNHITTKAAEGSRMDASEEKDLFDRWIWMRYSQFVAVYHAAFESRALYRATFALRQFFVTEFCDVYLEWVKVDARSITQDQKRLRLEPFRQILEKTLILAHPFMPFITEELWHQLGKLSSINVADQPNSSSIDAIEASSTIEDVEVILDTLKLVRAEVEQKQASRVMVQVASEELWGLLYRYKKHLEALSSCAAMDIRVTQRTPSASTETLRAVVVSTTLTRSRADTSCNDTPVRSTPQNLDIVRKRHLRALTKLERLESRLQTPAYDSKTPADIKAKDRVTLRALTLELCDLKKVLDGGPGGSDDDAL